ncbi:MAG: A/G-specific adenine glycosylase [Candidatus Omnitrophica bacterium]|nr:A/G-specific adenine glycosylase [Candidatus Omnitrophota bacterium]
MQKNLLKWFQKNARPLPWRKRYDPYEVWVSEIMLQQTQVETMLPYFERWVKTFPTLQSLAKSPEKKVLKCWEGLGYYSRARNLHFSAKEIVRKYGGVFPSDYEAIRALKGVGRYTAGAIASIAFNRERPIVDGNVLRVLSRVYSIGKPIDVEKNKETFWTIEENLIPRGQARFFNQAVMELGALVCASKNPQCLVCPIQSDCTAFRKNRVLDYPVRSRRKTRVKVDASAVLFFKKDKVLIRKRPLGEIMGGLWEFPEWKLAKDAGLDPGEIRKRTLIGLRSEFGFEPEKLKPLATIKRNYTHHLETLHIFSAPVPEAAVFTLKNDWPSRWITPREFLLYPFSSAHSKITKLIKPT